MKNFFKWFGSQLLALAIYGGMLLAALVVVLAFAMFFGIKDDTSSKQFVVDKLTTISQKWNVEALKPVASPDLYEQITKRPDEFANSMRELSSLGPLQNIEDIRGESNFQFHIGGTNATTAAYNAHVKYKNGRADVSICLLRIENAWRINCLSINRDVQVRQVI